MSNHPNFTSGNWTGFYLEYHRREPGWMQLYLDCNPQGVIRGEGIDYVGPWTLIGQYSPPTQQCEWTKSYVNRHRVEYEGLLGENGIVGDWRISPFLRGRFHVWPESMPHLYEQYLREGLPLPANDPIFDSLESERLPASGFELLTLHGDISKARVRLRAID